MGMNHLKITLTEFVPFFSTCGLPYLSNPLPGNAALLIQELEGYKAKYSNLFVTLMYCLSSNVIMNHIWF
jgi:hypothetical protein